LIARDLERSTKIGMIIYRRRKEKKRCANTHHASVNKCILEISVSSQELFLQEGGIFDVPIQGDVDCVTLREVLEVNCLEESHAAGGPELRPSGGSSIPLTQASREGICGIGYARGDVQ
jgi:hypothetical protein